MEMRAFGRTGVQVSVLCLGCMMFGGKTGPEDSYAIIDRALDAGINFLDTANVYSRGRSEEVTGEALKRNGKRQQVFLATKVHGRMDDNDVNAFGTSRRHIIAECDASLRRLQVLPCAPRCNARAAFGAPAAPTVASRRCAPEPGRPSCSPGCPLRGSPDRKARLATRFCQKSQVF